MITKATSDTTRRSGTLDIAFFGSSLVSAYWNGAATYYRGIIRLYHERGHRVTFFEPDAYQRQQHRDIDDPPYARIVVYPPTERGLDSALKRARGSDVVVKASGVGVFDSELEQRVLDLRSDKTSVIYWDVDAPATLDRLAGDAADPLAALLPRYDLVLTYGGGDPVVQGFEALGVSQCVPVYNAVDPQTHHPVPRDPDWECDLLFVGNRSPDREARVERFFLDAAQRLPDARFVLGGSGWSDKPMPANVRYHGHVYSRDHNVANSSALAALNISRQSMASYGHSPATRVFEAAGAAACVITDRWAGLEQFLEPGVEVLTADDGAEVAELVHALTPEQARKLGMAARRRVLSEHTYRHRAQQLESLLLGDGRTGATRHLPATTGGTS